MKTSREVESENSNLIIFSDDEEENEDIFPMQAYMSNSTKLFYLQAKSQQASTNTNSEQPLTSSLSISSKPVVQNRNSSLSFKNHISKRKHHSNFDQLLDYVEDIQGSQAKKRSKNLKLSMTEAMVEETKLNHAYLTEKAKTDKKQAKEDQEKHWKQVEYNCRQDDQYYAIEMAYQQAIFNQGELSILQSRERVLRLQMNLQKQLAASKNLMIKVNSNNLKEKELENI